MREKKRDEKGDTNIIGVGDTERKKERERDVITFGVSVVLGVAQHEC